ncbi:MAG TPA: universal stress protein [Chitinophagaceae bacterium]|nr:universal stress protein [Chitinophagaceae bacterium]
MKKILIALDYSLSAQRVAETGYELAKAMNAKAILLHVISDATYYSSLKYSPIMGYEGFSGVDIIQTDAAEQLVTASHKYLEKSKQHLGNKTIQTVVKSGACGEAILRTAAELNVDVIVMGTHSRRGFERILLGSIAENVLRHSLIPVFIIPIKIIEENDKAVEIK